MLRFLLALLRVVGDAKAVAGGRYHHRVTRRYAHRGLNQLLRKGGVR